MQLSPNHSEEAAESQKQLDMLTANLNDLVVYWHYHDIIASNINWQAVRTHVVFT